MKVAAWTVAWAAVEVLWMERHRRRAAERDAGRVWDGWVEIGFVGDGREMAEYRVHPSNRAWQPRSLN